MFLCHVQNSWWGSVRFTLTSKGPIYILAQKAFKCYTHKNVKGSKIQLNFRNHNFVLFFAKFCEFLKAFIQHIILKCKKGAGLSPPRPTPFEKVYLSCNFNYCYNVHTIPQRPLRLNSAPINKIIIMNRVDGFETFIYSQWTPCFKNVTCIKRVTAFVTVPLPPLRCKLPRTGMKANSCCPGNKTQR